MITMFHKESQRWCRIICATSDSPCGEPRVRVEWEGGTEESVVLESELKLMPLKFR